MAYEPTVWVNDSEPAINAANLNKLEQAVADASDLSGVDLSTALVSGTNHDTGDTKTYSLEGFATYVRTNLEPMAAGLMGLLSRIEALENAAE